MKNQNGGGKVIDLSKRRKANLNPVDFGAEFIEMWECNCGCVQFFITRSGFVCVECGAFQAVEWQDDRA